MVRYGSSGHRTGVVHSPPPRNHTSPHLANIITQKRCQFNTHFTHVEQGGNTGNTTHGHIELFVGMPRNISLHGRHRYKWYHQAQCHSSHGRPIQSVNAFLIVWHHHQSPFPIISMAARRADAQYLIVIIVTVTISFTAHWFNSGGLGITQYHQVVTNRRNRMFTPIVIVATPMRTGIHCFPHRTLARHHHYAWRTSNRQAEGASSIWLNTTKEEITS